MDQGNNGLSRGDRNRNARLAALRAVLPRDHAILGIDLALAFGIINAMWLESRSDFISDH